MENSAMQFRNVSGAFELIGAPARDPVLLIDDMVDSGWTMTVAASVLREGGSGPVFPFALSDSKGR
jgi:ATP-dependent DNA helicase RecQ